MGNTDEGRFMVAVGALIENSKTGKILLLKRSDKLDYAAGHWEIITGRMKQFEEIEVAIKREVEEETGLTDMEIVKPLRNTHFFRGEKTAENEIILLVYWIKTTQEEVKVSWEHSDFVWLSPEDAKAKTDYPEDIEAFLEAQA